MQTYISILRGINVSGHKMIKMEALRKMYEELKFKNVRTYIQSGNVIFQSTKAKPADLEKKIAQQILKESGFEVPVMVKELNELTDVLKKNPFVNRRKEDPAKLHVTFLSGHAEQTLIDKIKTGQYGSDEFILSGQAIYLFCPDGYGNTKLSNNFFENKLKVVATTRNWKTINELYRIGEEIISL